MKAAAVVVLVAKMEEPAWKNATANTLSNSSRPVLSSNPCSKIEKVKVKTSSAPGEERGKVGECHCSQFLDTNADTTRLSL